MHFWMCINWHAKEKKYRQHWLSVRFMLSPNILLKTYFHFINFTFLKVNVLLNNFHIGARDWSKPYVIFGYNFCAIKYCIEFFHFFRNYFLRKLAIKILREMIQTLTLYNAKCVRFNIRSDVKLIEDPFILWI